MTADRTGTVTIDRLALHAGVMSVAEARRLGELVAIVLAQLPIQAARDSATVNVPAQEGRSVEQLAVEVADAIAAALRVEAAS